ALAITDHGPGHLTYGIKRSAIPVMRREIERLKPLYPTLDIYLGVEANFINRGNCLDVTKEEAAQYDFILGGYHYGVTRGYCIRNYLDTHLPTGFGTGSLLKKNTEMALTAIYENEIKILTHPGDKGPFDVLEMAKACAKRGTLMEISTWHSHLTVEEIKIAAKTEVRFVISSDAHSPKRVGTFWGGVERVLAAGLDMDRVVNIARL
ncbi:MAG: histidinol-phosphatase, partial [Anaerovorax sp.]